MKAAYLQDADQAAVSEAVVERLRRRGALVTEHTHSHVRFEGLNPGRAYSFAKGGYAGAYRHAGEKDVELRLKVEATGPARAFWTVVVLDLVLVVLLFATNPPSSAWVGLAALLWAAFVVALLVYVGTWRTSWDLERELLADVIADVKARPGGPTAVLTEDERRAREFEEELEGELTARNLRARRPAPAPSGASGASPPSAKPRFRLPFGRKPKG